MYVDQSRMSKSLTYTRENLKLKSISIIKFRCICRPCLIIALLCFLSHFFSFFHLWKTLLKSIAKELNSCVCVCLSVKSCFRIISHFQVLLLILQTIQKEYLIYSILNTCMQDINGYYQTKCSPMAADIVVTLDKVQLLKNLGYILY